MRRRCRNRSLLCTAVFALGGCMSAEAASDWSNAVAERPAYDQSSETTQVAEVACRQALAAEFERSLADTRVDYVLISEAGLGVWMSVRGVEAQWVCQSNIDGNVAGIGEAPLP